MLRCGLKSLDELNAAEETEKITVAIISLSINDFKFPKIPLNPVEATAF
jgi:hypothetical protein